jgi:aminoglycoside/choline kinase family phosphotransferase
MTENRTTLLTEWLSQYFSEQVVLVPLVNDASFRQYFRLCVNGISYVAMDAPPLHEDVHSFVAVARGLGDLGLSVPRVIHADLARGFLLLSDLGDELYQGHLKHDTAEALYDRAFGVLAVMQTAQAEHFSPFCLPLFDQKIFDREWALFHDWYMDAYLQDQLSVREQAQLADIHQLLWTNFKDQPQVFVHRDFHSRNLMVMPESQVGILDFQDAVWGPITYDLVSLVRDAYLDWPTDQVAEWMRECWQRLPSAYASVSPEQWQQWADWTGVQRHLKILGIFARLALRDNKQRYLQDVPRVKNYLLQVCGLYRELEPLVDLLNRQPCVVK